ncbi:MAG: hypothetical protein NTAFB05_14480 [Nitrobacter sp.]|uniref:DUF5801 repeats-in-toxin domain-containing protein n=1 Tax=Nitrobacter sp. TaxID=29420 RepID=UPI00387DE1B4
MNGPFQVAQADTSGTGSNGGDKQHPRIVKITKPYGDQSVVVSLSYDGSVKADLSAIASEKITLVHIGEKLIILFDNHSTVTLEPFFDSTGKPLQDITVEVAPGRDITSAEFATLFPVTDDQSVLPAAGTGDGSGAQASGANFTSVGIDPLAVGNPLALLGQEELPGFKIDNILAENNNNQGFGPTPGFSLSGTSVVEDETAGVQSAADGANDQPLADLPAPLAALAEAIGWAQSHDPVVGASTATFGTAKTGTVTYALTDAGGHAFNGVDSGLKATVSGNEIFLYTVGGLVVGREGTGGVPDADGKIVFALYLEPDLKLDVAQYAAISHPDTGNPNDSVNLGGLVHVTQTVTAGTLVATATFPAISISFLDDGPTLSVTAPGVINGFDFGNFAPNGNAWGKDSGVATGHNGGWTIADANDGHAAGDQIGNTGSGAVQLERVGDGYQGMHSSNNGDMVDLDASPHDVKISQTVTGLVNDQIYDLRFEAGAPFPDSAHLEIWFGGQLIADITPNGQMTAYDLKITGGFGDGSNLLEFRETGTPDNQGTYLANVSVGVIVIDETAGNQAGTNDVDSNTSFDAVANKGVDADMTGGPQFAAGISAVVHIAADFGTDGPWHNSAAEATVYSLSATVNGTDSGLMTTARQEIYLFNETYGGVTYVVGRVGDAQGDAAFAFRIDPTTGVLSLVQYVSLHQPDTNSNNEGVFLNTGSLSVTVTVTDGDGDHVSQSADISANIRFDDDGPTLTVTADGEAGSRLTIGLDETVGDDRYNAAIGESPDSGNHDDAAGTLAQVTTSLGNGGLASLFDVTAIYGADGKGAEEAHGFAFTGISAGGVETNLKATNGGPITLYLDGATNTIVGKAMVGGIETDVLTIKIVDTVDGPQLQTTLYAAIDHGSDGNKFDSEAILSLLDGAGPVGLQMTVTVTDGDGDTATRAATVDLITSQGSAFHFDDDGPVIRSVTPDQGAYGPNLIVNGSFENHPQLGGSDWEIFNQIAGWSAGNGVPFEVQTGGAGGVPGNSTAIIELDGDFQGNGHSNQATPNPESSNSTIQQAVAGTHAGETYELTFWYAPRGDAATTAGLEVTFGGVKVFDSDDATYAANTWQQITIEVTAPVDDAVLAFTGTGTPDEFGALIDDVSLKAVHSQVLDDENLAHGIAGGPGDDGFGLVSSGKIDFDAGSDGLRSIEAALSNGGLHGIHVGTDGIGTSYAIDTAWVAGKDAAGNATAGFEKGGTLVGTMNVNGVDVPAFTLEIRSDGTYTFTLQAPLDHPGHGAAGSFEDNLALDFGFTITDGDGDYTTSTLTISVDDDSPVLVDQDVPHYHADEGDIVTLQSVGTSPNDGAGDGSVTGSPADNLTGPAVVTGSLAGSVDFGADGEGGFSFTADAAATLDALGLTSKGGTIHYVVNGNTLTAYVDRGNGHYDSHDRTVFTLTVDAATGQFQFKLYDQLDHVDDGTNSKNTALQGANDTTVDGLDFGSLILATDGDGDGVALAGKLTIEITDDVPAVTLTATGASVTIDETAGEQGNDVGWPVTLVVAPQFQSVANVGHDPDMDNKPIYATNIAPVVAGTFLPGADEPAHAALSLQINGVPVQGEPGVDSGLRTTEGAKIYLVEENGLIVGRIDGNQDGVFDGNAADVAAFAIALSPLGNISIAQYLSIRHDINPDQNDTKTLGQLVSVELAVTDNDGDTVTRSVTIGDHIVFRDDGPTLTDSPVTAAVNEANIHTLASQGTDPDFPAHTDILGAAYATGSLSGTVDPGADGLGSFSFTANAVSQLETLHLSSKGEALSYTFVDGVLVGYVDHGSSGPSPSDRPVFALTLTANGNYNFELFDQLDHDKPPSGADTNTTLQDGNPDLATGAIDFGRIIQVTDGDGDSITLDGAFSVTVTDDIPKAVQGGQVHGVVEEEQLRGGNEDTTGGSGAYGDGDGQLLGFFLDNTTQTVSGVGFNSLATLVDPGADDGGKFSFVSQVIGSGVTTDGGSPVLSHGGTVSVTGTTSGSDIGGHYELLTAGTTGAGAHDVFTLKVYDNGNWTFTLKAPLDDLPADNIEGVEKLNLSGLLQYTDYDGDAIALDGNSFLVGVIDDVPTVSVKGISSGPDLKTYDAGTTDGGHSTASASFAGSFAATSHYGADGPGETVTTYSLDITASPDSHGRVDSHLDHQGQSVYLYENAQGAIVGSTALSAGDVSGANTVFTVSVDSSGQVTLTQYESIDHGLPGATQGPYDGQTKDLASHLISLVATATITDYDGDQNTDSAKIDLGGNIKFADDGPQITGFSASGTVIQDETPGVQNASNPAYDPAHDPNPSNDVSYDNLSTPVKTLFDNVAQKGVDNDVNSSQLDHGALGYAFSAGVVQVGGVDYGADGAAASNAKIISLAINGGNQADSGLRTTDGHEIYLFIENGLIVGRYDGTGSGSAVTNGYSSNNPQHADGSFVDPAAFAIAIDQDGGISVAQYVSLKNPVEGSSDADHDDPTTGFLQNVQAVLTVTDGDGDHAAKTIDISGNIVFQDDGPTLSLSHIDGIANGLFFGGFTSNNNAWGQGSGVANGHADGWTITSSDTFGSTQLEKVGEGYRGAESPTHSVMVDLEATPGNVQVSQTIHGLAGGATYNLTFEIGLGAPNSGDYPDTAKVEVFWNGISVGIFVPDTGTMQTISLPVTAGSGDNELAFREVGAGGDNTGTYLANVKLSNVIIVDETAGKDPDSSEVNAALVSGLFAGVQAGTDHDMSPQYAQGSGAIVAASVDYGADGPSASDGLKYAFDLGSNGPVHSGLETTGHAPIDLVLDSQGRVLGVYSDGGDVVAAFALHIDAATGQVTVAQYVSLRHGDTTSNDEGVSLDANTLGVSVTATDGDGDYVTKSLDISANIRFEDDGPVALGGNVDVGRVYEDGLHNSVQTGNLEGAPASQPTTITITHDNLTALVSFGADGPGEFGFNAAAQGAMSGLTSDGSPIHYEISGGTLSGITADNRLIFTLGADGSGGYTFTLLGNIDHPASGDTGTLTLNLASLFTATDGDGDSAVLNGGLNITIENDVPVVATQTNLIVNGSFEQGHDDLGAGQWSIYNSLDGTWTSADLGDGRGNVPFEVQINNTDGSGPGGVPAQDGNTLIELDSDLTGGNLSGHANNTGHTNSTIQQTVAGTEDGQTYMLTFWYAPRPSEGDPDSGSMEVLWNGDVVKTIDSTGMAPGAWQQITVFVEGTGPGDVLGFHAIGQENSLGALIDNVSLVAAVVVDEDGLVPDGHHDQPTPSAGDIAVPDADHDHNEATATGLLGIKWGADNADTGVDSVDSTAGASGRLVQDHPDGVGDRSVTFDSAAPAAFSGTLTAGHLTSHGEDIHFSFNGDQTILYGKAGTGNDIRTVFEVSLSDDGSGSFRFVLLDRLDHALGDNENNIALSFNYVATDSDGDSTPGSFTVVVNDDVPVVTGETATGNVSEGDIPVPVVTPFTFTFDSDAPDQTPNLGSSNLHVPGSHVALVGSEHVLYGPDAPLVNGQPTGFSPFVLQADPGTSFTLNSVNLSLWGSGNLNATAIGIDIHGVQHSVTLSLSNSQTPSALFTAFAGLELTHFEIDNPGFSGRVILDNLSVTSTIAPTQNYIETTIDLTSLVDIGPDQPGTWSLTSFASQNVGTLSYNGTQITMSSNGDTITGVAGGTVIFTLTMSTSEAGHAIFDLYKPIDGGLSNQIDFSNFVIVTDYDGDSVKLGAGEFLVNINSVDHLPSVSDVTVSVSEAGLPPHGGLPAGSGEMANSIPDDNSDKSETHTGTIAISLGDGPSVVTVKGQAVDASFVGHTISGDFGDLTITSFSSTAIGYSYTLFKSTIGNGTHDDFDIKVTDIDNQTSSATLTIDIVNDAPVAHDDTNSVTGGGTLEVLATDGVLNNDVAGADGFASGGGVVGVAPGDTHADLDNLATVGHLIHGQYGDLTLNADGSYAYARATTTAGTVNDVFTYTIKDGDGDLSHATLTIQSENAGVTVTPPEVGGATDTVYEAGLPARSGEPSGSSVGGTNTVATGSVGVDAPDGVASIKVDDHNVALTGEHTLIDDSAHGGSLEVWWDAAHSEIDYKYTLTDNYLKSPAVDDGRTSEVKPTFAVTVTDSDGSTNAPANLTIDIIDDAPVAVPESESVSEKVVQDFNGAFVLDFSGSIDGSEYSQMLNAVKAAGDEIFANATGDVKIELVAFSSSANAYGPYTTQTAFDTEIAYLLAHRPLNSGTDYTAGIKTLMAHYTAVAGANNQVFFLSDGNPNEQVGSNGALDDTTATNWNNFVNNATAPISVTTIGIGNGLDNGTLHKVDVDGHVDTVNVSQFSDLIDALVTLVGSDASGNVLSNGDAFGADGGRILSITFDGHTYTWNGKTDETASITETDSGGNAIATIGGTQLAAVGTSLSGHFTFYFAASGSHAAGDWSYSAPQNLVSDANETFTYVLADNDGDHASAALTIAVTAVNDAPVNSVPGAQSINEDTALVFSAANGNRISVSDVDSNGGDEQVTLDVQHGALTLAAVAGLTVVGNNTGHVTLTGDLTHLNAALDGLTYQGNSHYSGSDTLTITTNDNGHTGTGGPLSDTDTVAITVQHVNHAPVIESDLTVVSSYGSNQFTVSDAAFLNYVLDPDGDPLTVSSVSHSSGFAKNGLSHSNSDHWVFIDDDSTPGGTFDVTVSDGQGSTDTAHVTYQQDTNDLILDGTAGDDIIVAGPALSTQVTTITFDPSYDKNDTVYLTVGSTQYSYKVGKGGASAETVYEGLTDSHGNHLNGGNAGGVTWAAHLDSNHSVTLTGDPGDTFSISSGFTNKGGTVDQGKPSVTTISEQDGYTLAGHDGNDVLIGSTGPDVFAFGAGEYDGGSHNSIDTILNYSHTQGDVLDLGALLDAVYNGHQTTNDVRLQASGSSDISVQVDTSGSNAGDWHTVAILSGYNHAGNVVDVVLGHMIDQSQHQVVV